MDHGIEYGEAGERSNAVEFSMPAPTFLPLLLAFGLLLVFAGIIFTPIATYLGLLVSLLAAVGWWRNVIPNETHESVPLEVKHRPSEIKVVHGAVIRLKVGGEKHRMRIPIETHSYTAGALGGLAGGVVMAGLACLYGFIAQHSIWFPVNLLAGVVIPGMGNETLEQLRAFDGLAFAAAFIGHLGLSVLVGVLYAMLLPMFPKFAFFWAGILVPLIWCGMAATLLTLINPALNERVSWPWFIACQLAFGLVCGFIVARSERIQTLQSLTFAERANMDAPGVSSREQREDA